MERTNAQTRHIELSPRRLAVRALVLLAAGLAFLLALRLGTSVLEALGPSVTLPLSCLAGALLVRSVERAACALFDRVARRGILTPASSAAIGASHAIKDL